VARSNAEARLSVFKGREARLNRAIFQILATRGAQIIYDVHRQVRTFRGRKSSKYATVNKRVKVLEESGYVIRVGVKKTKAGFEAALFELSGQAILAQFLYSMSIEEVIERLDDATALSILAFMTEFVGSICSRQ
jgi:Fe2+ or Zn2+ uptake regulation protein